MKIPVLKLKNISNIRFILAGYSATYSINWQKMENVFNKARHYERRNGRPLDSYMKVYEDADICIAPLENNIFTPFKSNLKILEAGCKYMPMICSNTPPYSDEPNKDMVMYASNVREWVHWIKYCHDNPNYVKESGLRLGEYVREKYELTKINELRKQLFEHLIN